MATPAGITPARSVGWQRFAMRGLRVEAVTLVIAACLWALTLQPFWLTVVYSLCI